MSDQPQPRSDQEPGQEDTGTGVPVVETETTTGSVEEVHEDTMVQPEGDGGEVLDLTEITGDEDDDDEVVDEEVDPEEAARAAMLDELEEEDPEALQAALDEGERAAAVRAERNPPEGGEPEPITPARTAARQPRPTPQPDDTRPPLRERLAGRLTTAADRLRQPRPQTPQPPPPGEPGQNGTAFGVYAARIVIAVLALIALGWIGSKTGKTHLIGWALLGAAAMAGIFWLWRVAFPAANRARFFSAGKGTVMLVAGIGAAYWAFPSELGQMANQGMEVAKSQLNPPGKSADSAPAEESGNVAKVEAPKPKKPASELPLATEIGAMVDALAARSAAVYADQTAQFQELMKEGDNAQRAAVVDPRDCEESPAEEYQHWFPTFNPPLTEAAIAELRVKFQSTLATATDQGADTESAKQTLVLFKDSVAKLQAEVEAWNGRETGMLAHFRQTLSYVNPDELTGETAADAYHKAAAAATLQEESEARKRQAAIDAAANEAKQLEAQRQAEFLAVRMAVVSSANVQALMRHATIGRGLGGSLEWHFWPKEAIGALASEPRFNEIFPKHLAIMQKIGKTSLTEKELNDMVQTLFASNGEVTAIVREALAKFRGCKPEDLPAEDLWGYVNSLALNNTPVNSLAEVFHLVAKFAPKNFDYSSGDRDKFREQMIEVINRAPKAVPRWVINDPNKGINSAGFANWPRNVQEAIYALRYFREKYANLPVP